MAQPTFEFPNGQQAGNVKPIKKADGFLNLALKRAGGSEKGSQIVGIPLDFADPAMKQLFDLAQTPEGIEKIRAALIFSANLNTPPEKRGEFLL